MIRRTLHVTTEGLELFRLGADGVLQRPRWIPGNFLPVADAPLRADALCGALRELLQDEAPGSLHLVLDDMLLDAELVVGIDPGTGDVERQLNFLLSPRARQALKSATADYRLYRSEATLSAMVYHCPPERLRGLEEALARTGQTISALEPASAAEIRFLFFMREDLRRRNLLYIRPDRLRTLILVLVEGDPVLYRMMDHGLEHLRRGGTATSFLPENLRGDERAERLLQGFRELGEGFSRLVDAIADSVRGVQIHFQRRRFFDGFHLAGPAAAWEDFSLYLEEYLRLPRLEWGESTALPGSWSEMSTRLAGLAPLLAGQEDGE